MHINQPSWSMSIPSCAYPCLRPVLLVLAPGQEVPGIQFVVVALNVIYASLLNSCNSSLPSSVALRAMAAGKYTFKRQPETKAEPKNNSINWLNLISRHEDRRRCFAAAADAQPPWDKQQVTTIWPKPTGQPPPKLALNQSRLVSQINSSDRWMAANRCEEIPAITRWKCRIVIDATLWKQVNNWMNPRQQTTSSCLPDALAGYRNSIRTSTR